MVFTGKFHNTKTCDSRKTKNKMGKRCPKGGIAGLKNTRRKETSQLEKNGGAL